MTAKLLLFAAFLLAILIASRSFVRGECRRQWNGLQGVRYIADECGGDRAQCDLIQLTFLEAALRARRANLERALVAEHTAQKPPSRFNRRLEARLAGLTSFPSRLQPYVPRGPQYGLPHMPGSFLLAFVQG